MLGKLNIPYLSVTFDVGPGNAHESHLSKTLEDLKDALVRFLPHLRYLSLCIGEYTAHSESAVEPIKKTWWRIRQHDANGEAQILAEAIPQSQFERARNHLRSMDYASRARINPDEIEFSCNI